MRECEWPDGDGTVRRGIAFPCRRKACTKDVLVDEDHPQFAELKASQNALCNACLHKQLNGA